MVIKSRNCFFKPKIQISGISSIFLLVFSIYLTYSIHHDRNLGFSVKKITSNFSYEPSRSIKEPQGEELDKLRNILRQPYTFLSAGLESYVFLSEDKKYVIKFFRMTHLLPKMRDLFSDERRTAYRKRILDSFKGYRLAYEEMGKESGLIYVHLNKTDHLKISLKVKDKLRRRHQIDLDHVEFIVQERAEPIFDQLEKFASRKEREQLKKAIVSMLELVRRERALNLTDMDKDGKKIMVTLSRME